MESSCNDVGIVLAGSRHATVNSKATTDLLKATTDVGDVLVVVYVSIVMEVNRIYLVSVGILDFELFGTESNKFKC
jgi:hypothetical protein